jgi:DNA gyrase/topoisomerase IV subunit B
MVIAFLKNVKNTKFNSQAKEKITNSIKEINDYFGEIPYDSIVQKIFKNPEIIDPITEVYRIKEEFKRRQELKGLNKPVKKIKSEKYLPSIGVKKYLILCEGASAVGGLSPILGRKECGYFELRGVPLNAYSADQKKFLANPELSDLFKVIQNENYDYIIFGNDADLDGIHIAGLLTGFFERYMPELKGRIGRLLTPVKFLKKNNKPVKWVYTINEELIPKKGEEFSYVKGLGTWDIDDLKYIIEKDGLKKMIDMFDFDSKEIIEEWLGDNSEPRKKYILENDFNIAKL